MRIRLNWLVFLLYVCAFLLSAPNAVIAADKQVFKDEAGEVLYTIDENGIVSMFENGPGTDITLSVTRGTREQMQPQITEVTPNAVAAGTHTRPELEGNTPVGVQGESMTRTTDAGAPACQPKPRAAGLLQSSVQP